MKNSLLIFTAAFTLTTFGSAQHKQEETIRQNQYKIAYNVHLPDTVNDDWEIFTMNLDGTDKKNIINHPDVAWTYHSYKNRLFFISDRDTSYRSYFLYESNGNNIRKISDLQLEDSWMSSRNDGEELVVAGRIGKEIRYQLFIINTKTGSFVQITFDTSAMLVILVFRRTESKLFSHIKRIRETDQLMKNYF